MMTNEDSFLVKVYLAFFAKILPIYYVPRKHYGGINHHSSSGYSFFSAEKWVDSQDSTPEVKAFCPR